jgi:preprotein translocase subunit SecD/preprotein translocase subunit SecF
LALFGGESISGFAWVMLFGIVVGTSSSIFIAAPILLFLGEHRLRREAAPAPTAIPREGGPAAAPPAKAKDAPPTPPAKAPTPPAKAKETPVPTKPKSTARSSPGRASR